MMFRIHHITDISYTSTVRLARFNVRLKPFDWPGQHLYDFSLSVDSKPGLLSKEAISNEDGPYVVNSTRLFLSDPITSLKIETRFTIDVSPVDIPSGVSAPSVADLRKAAWASRDISRFGPTPYLFNSQIARMDDEIGEWAAPYLAPESSILEAGQALMRAIFTQFKYESGATQTETPPTEAFAQRSGVCQDFAHIMIIALRTHGIPAAYVSGYLRTLPPPGKPRLIGADAMHAWINLWCGEELGWIGLDPTNDQLARGDHIFIAMGRDYADVAPIDGVFHGGDGQSQKVAVDVEPLGLG